MVATFYLHIHWNTVDRAPMIGPPERDVLRRFLPAEAQRHGAEVVACGMVNDHVHLLLRVPVTWDLPRIMQGLKGGSARVLNQNPDRSGRLKWAPGYNAKSVSPGVVPTVINYIKNQPKHHPERRIPD
jgi:REP element-mobilizing transposase RayT